VVQENEKSGKKTATIKTLITAKAHCSPFVYGCNKLLLLHPRPNGGKKPNDFAIYQHTLCHKKTEPFFI